MKIVFLLGACLFVSLTIVDAWVHVETHYVTQIVPGSVQVDTDVQPSNVNVETDTNPDVVQIKLHIPGVTQIVNAGLTIIYKLLREAVNVIRLVSPSAATALDDIITKLKITVENITTVGGISSGINNLILIVEDAIKVVEGVIDDVETTKSGILVELLQALKNFLGGLKTVKPAADLASGIFGK